MVASPQKSISYRVARGYQAEIYHVSSAALYGLALELTAITSVLYFIWIISKFKTVTNPRKPQTKACSQYESRGPCCRAMGVRERSKEAWREGFKLALNWTSFQKGKRVVDGLWEHAYLAYPRTPTPNTRNLELL